MESRSVLDRLLELAVAVLGEPVSPEASRENTEAWNSLRHIELLFAVEEAFGCPIPPELWPQLDSIQAIASWLEGAHVP
nr:MAG: hypothetical protein KatS3mg041_2006 [Bacteroidota bacterium]